MIPVQATHPGHVWPDDVLYDHGLHGTPLTVVTVLDECTRQGLALEGATSWPAPRGLAGWERLVARHGTPQCIRSDHGPECIAWAGRGWLARPQMTTLDMALGSRQHGDGERLNGTMRDEGWHRHVFHAGAEARGGSPSTAGPRRQNARPVV
jgi:putative transposase